MSNEIELKQLVDDESFVVNMNKAFADLRADYELAMDFDKAKLNELRDLHVDVKNHLSHLSTVSRTSCGTISGLRGTGKTHLLLLARHNINSSLWKEKNENNLCIYLNLKRLNLPADYSEDVFNRVFSIFIYRELVEQLMLILFDQKDKTVLERLKTSFDSKRKRSKCKLVRKRIETMIALAQIGNEFLENLGADKTENETTIADEKEVVAGIGASLSAFVPSSSLKISQRSVQKTARKYKRNSTYLSYCNISSVRKQLIELIGELNLDSITFYIDEWEKKSNEPHCQEYASSYINMIMDHPLYFWISVVPHRGGLYSLVDGADLQHQINLDEDLIYENSDQDKATCLNYFKEFINKRLNKYFSDEEYTYSLLFNHDDNLSLLILASMGNTRDFGTMLLNCWKEYQNYIRAPHAPGRPNKYISQAMVNEAIKKNGVQKYSNIEQYPEVIQVWNHIQSFCLEKKSSHFAVEEKSDKIECLNSPEFSELIYQRLIHLRKMHVPAKDSEVESKLSIYAVNYAVTFNLHAQDRKMIFITDRKSIHDKVRRYIYDPAKILGELRIKNGTECPCMNCKQIIRPSAMKSAWDSNTCPYCGKNIHN